MGEAGLHALRRQGLEAELGAPGRQRIDDAGDVVADEDEPGDLGGRLDDAAEGGLRVGGDGISLVEDDDLEGGVGVAFRVASCRGGSVPLPAVPGGAGLGLVAHGQAGEVLDLVSDDADAALIGGVELQDPPLEGFRVPQGAAECQGDAGLAGSRRAVEEQVGQPVGLYGILQGRHHLGLVAHVGEALGPILLHPRRDGALGVEGGCRRHVSRVCVRFDRGPAQCDDAMMR